MTAASISSHARSRVFSLLSVFPVLTAFSNSQTETHKLKRAGDDDTLLLTNGEKVRLIGADTPEVHESERLYRDDK